MSGRCKACDKRLEEEDYILDDLGELCKVCYIPLVLDETKDYNAS